MPAEQFMSIAQEHAREPGVPLIEDGAEFETFSALGNARAADRRRPTVAFLDVFSTTEVSNPTYLDGKKNPLSHGATSALAVEQRGYNVLKLHLKDDQLKDVESFPKALTELASGIENGRLRLGKGDAINLSLYYYVGEYRYMSRLLGMEIRPDNISERRQEILKRECSAIEDVSPLNPARKDLQILCQINHAIDRIKKTGVEVVSIAGNSGRDKFNFGFLASDTVLSAVNSAGAVYPWSGTNAFTTPAVGSYRVTYERQNLFSGEPLTEQVGVYRLAGTQVQYNARMVNDIHSSKLFYTEKDGVGVTITPDEEAFPAELLDPERIAQQPNSSQLTSSSERADLEAKIVRTTSALHSPSESNPETFKLAAAGNQAAVKRLETLSVRTSTLSASAYPYEKYPVYVVAGTSFANIKYFWDQYERLYHLKNGN